MPHPLIILGAGASNGCLNEEQKRYRKKSLDFPLVNEIFHPKYFSYVKDNIKPENLKRFVDPLSTKEIKDVLLGGDQYLKQISARLMNRESLEKEVSAFWETAKGNNKQIQKQLITFSYYLQSLFYFLSEDAAKEEIPGNSYYALVSEIVDLLFKEKNAEVFVVNFNYDLLMQNALIKTDPAVANRIRHKQIHGSCDKCWICLADQRKNRPRAPWENLRSQKNRIENWDFNEFFEHGPEEYGFTAICNEIRNGGLHIARPVLTLPFFEKQEYNKHRYQEIAWWFEHIDKILIIGWSAKDNDLIELISENTRGRLIPLSVVAGSKDDIKDIFNKFPEKKFSRAAEFVGFNEFMNNQACKTFFGTP